MPSLRSKSFNGFTPHSRQGPSMPPTALHDQPRPVLLALSLRTLSFPLALFWLLQTSHFPRMHRAHLALAAPCTRNAVLQTDIAALTPFLLQVLAQMSPSLEVFVDPMIKNSNSSLAPPPSMPSSHYLIVYFSPHWSLFHILWILLIYFYFLSLPARTGHPLQARAAVCLA